MLISCFYSKKSMVLGVRPGCCGESRSFWKKGKLPVGVGSLGAPRKRERWRRLRQGARQGRLSRGLASPGSPCWNQPGTLEAFKRAAWKVKENGAANQRGKAYLRHGGLWQSQMFGYFRSHPHPSHHFCHTCSPHTISCHTCSPPQLLPVTPTLFTAGTRGPESPPPPSPLHSRLFFPQMATTTSLITHALLAMRPRHSSHGVDPPGDPPCGLG